MICASACCIDHISQIIKSQILPTALQYISKKFSNPTSWFDFYVAELVCGSIMNGPSGDDIYSQLAGVFDSILKLGSKGQCYKIRYTSAWLMSRITEFCPKMVFTSQESLQAYFDYAFAAMADIPAIGSLATHSIKHLFFNGAQLGMQVVLAQFLPTILN